MSTRGAAAYGDVFGVGAARTVGYRIDVGGHDTGFRRFSNDKEAPGGLVSW